MADMEVIVRLQDQGPCASITCMIRHYVARRAKVISDHPHNAAVRMFLSEVWPCWPWLGPLGHDRFPSCGQVQDKGATPLVQPWLSPARADAAAEPAWLDVVITSAAVADPDLPDAGPLLGQARTERHTKACAGGGGVRIAADHQGASTCRGSGQDAPGHRLVALGPAPACADGPVEQNQAQWSGCGAFAQNREMASGDPAVTDHSSG
jgi:hypothetical protein